MKLFHNRKRSCFLPRWPQAKLPQGPAATSPRVCGYLLVSEFLQRPAGLLLYVLVFLSLSVRFICLTPHPSKRCAALRQLMSEQAPVMGGEGWAGLSRLYQPGKLQEPLACVSSPSLLQLLCPLPSPHLKTFKACWGDFPGNPVKALHWPMLGIEFNP